MEIYYGGESTSSNTSNCYRINRYNYGEKEKIYPKGATISEYDEQDPSFSIVKISDGIREYISLPSIVDTTESSARQDKLDRKIIDQENLLNMRFSEQQSTIDRLTDTINKNLNISMMHGCRCCGAHIKEVDINKPIFHCEYCGATYIIGTVHQGSVY